MLRKFRERMESEQGFTLIELLVVILIIGILAAIALPAFLGQQKKGEDAGAKSNARNLVSEVESCVADKSPSDYAACDTAAELGATGLKVTAAGTVPANGKEVAVTGASTTGFTVVGTSSSGQHYAINKDATTGVSTHTCGTTMTAGGDGGGTANGGCRSAGTVAAGDGW